MSHHSDIFDCEGKKISVGNNVVLVRLTDHLLEDLPSEDQKAINAQVGRILKVIAFDDYGFAEIAFEYKGEDSEVTSHTIWVEPHYLKNVHLNSDNC